MPTASFLVVSGCVNLFWHVLNLTKHPTTTWRKAREHVNQVMQPGNTWHHCIILLRNQQKQQHFGPSFISLLTLPYLTLPSENWIGNSTPVCHLLLRVVISATNPASASGRTPGFHQAWYPFTSMMNACAKLSCGSMWQHLMWRLHLRNITTVFRNQEIGRC